MVEKESIVQAFAFVLILWPELRPYMADPQVQQIYIDPTRKIWMTVKGVELNISIGENVFAKDRLVRDLQVISEILTGTQLDTFHPTMQFTFEDGSSIAAVIPPILLDGVTVTLSRLRLPEIS